MSGVSTYYPGGTGDPARQGKSKFPCERRGTGSTEPLAAGQGRWASAASVPLHYAPSVLGDKLQQTESPGVALGHTLSN